MSKKQFIITLIIVLVIFLLGNLQYFPGPVWIAEPAIFANSIVTLLGVIGVLLAPVFLLLWLAMRKSNIRKASYYLSLSCLFAAAFLTLKSTSAFADFSRNTGIRNAQPLVAAIERYKTEHGSYPANFNAEKYESGIIGIGGYRYTFSNNSYTINFCQNRLLLFNLEMIVYDPTGARESDGGLPKTYNTPYRNWYYYTFD